jgi:DNA-binding IclR family transcriptional regulator
VPTERRDLAKRAAVFQRILRNVVANPTANFTFQGFRDLLGVPEAAARRILDSLVTAGLVAEVQRGVWARTWSQVYMRRAGVNG